MAQLGRQELADILNGSAFLASGGGGSREMGEQILNWILEKSETVELIKIEEVAAEQWGVVPFAGGAPSKVPPSTKDTFLRLGFSSKMFASKGENSAGRFALPDLEKVASAPFDLLESIMLQQKELPENHSFESFSYVMPLEIGTGNTFLAMFVAVSKSIAIVDCDGAGRSIPSLNMLTYSVSDIPVHPATMATITSDPEKKTKVAIHVDQVSKSNALITEIMQTNEFNNEGVMASYVMDGNTLQNKHPVIANTISLAQNVGSVLRQAKEKGKDPVAALLQFFNDPGSADNPSAFLLFQGTIAKIDKQNIGRLDKITVVLKKEEEEVCVLVLNENLIACRDRYPFDSIEQPIAMGPDLICYLTPDGTPLTNEEIKEGQELAVIGLKAPEQSRQTESIINSYLEGLKILGYNGLYVPIEELQNG
ncbi:DUF917 domain-containing protein [Microseira wollei]|uniref:DUF917 domain-containing protein n=1 Tax=Microseira wollei NIES-4236 TaxID=2530354 RepID=A0AAV3XE70_9CYAN|nr:DUF917 domain-containing protein [Microseira wollei]GET39721.1 hypothetical protein MiSe_44930 [Microseira wollei NIES-4236]